MHYNSLYSFKDFIKEFLVDYKGKKLKILDVGSMSLNGAGTYRRYIKDPLWEYTGIDIESGTNVDTVCKPYSFPYPDNHFDVVCSGSTLEHVEDMYAWIKEIARVSNNFVWINVPNTCKEHKHPLDCWRIFPDGMKFLLKEIAGLEIIRVERSNRDSKDTIGIAKKI